MGRPSKATPELIEAVLADLALGLTRELACASNGISLDTWERIEKRPQYSGLRAKALAARVKYLLTQVEANKEFGNYKAYAWLLERTKAYQGMFAPPEGPKVAIVNQQNDNRAVYLVGQELEDARVRLDAVKERQRARELTDAVDAAKNDNGGRAEMFPRSVATSNEMKLKMPDKSGASDQ